MATHAGTSWVQRHLPNLYSLARYDRRSLRGDLLGGLTVAAYLVPQVMAYAVIAGLPPVVGLWAILPALALYAIFGSSRQLSIGPESTTALMTAAVVGPLADGDPARYAALAAGLALLVGLLCLVCWVARLGFVADLLSRPVLVGYMAGIGVIMIIGQLEKLTGVPIEGENFLGELKSFFTNLSEVDPATALLGIAVLVFLYVFQWLWRQGPGPLLAVLAATAAVAAFGLEKYGITVIGQIPSGLPVPALPSLTEIPALILPAVGVLLVGYTDNVLTARSFAARRDYQIDSNQELLALGAGNVGSSLFQGFPISSSASRTALGDAAGARTQMYSLVALAGALATLLFLSPVLAHFPTAALGAIVVYAALKLIVISDFRRLATFRINEFVLAIAAFISVLAVGILYGVLIAVGLSVAEMLARVARPHDAILGLVPDLAGMHDVDDYPSAHTIAGLVVYRYDSPLFFANAEDFRRRALGAFDDAPEPVAWFVLNAEANVEVDITALDALEALRSELAARGTRFCMARVKQDLLVQLQAYGLADSIGTDYLFPTLPTAVAAYRDWVEKR